MSNRILPLFTLEIEASSEEDIRVNSGSLLGAHGAVLLDPILCSKLPCQRGLSHWNATSLSGLGI